MADMSEKSGFAPLLCDSPRMLVLGSLPGDRSLAEDEYYAHPSNRFWKVLAALCGEPLPSCYEAKKRMLARAGILLWDVYASARRMGSMDADIRGGSFNDIAGLLARFPSVGTVVLNGRTAQEAFSRYLSRLPERERHSIAGMRICPVPSTSPANARYTLAGLVEAWAEAFRGASALF